MFDLQMFAGGHSVAITKGDHVTTATASASSDVQKDAEVTLTIVVADGYAPVYQVIAGGVTIDPDTKKFTMGESDVSIVVTAKATNLYKVLETTTVTINDSKMDLVKGVKLVYAPNGAVSGAEITPTTITNAGMVDALLKAGLIEPA